MGMAISEPPLLLKALEERIKVSADIEELRLYYMHFRKTLAGNNIKI